MVYVLDWANRASCRARSWSRWVRPREDQPTGGSPADSVRRWVVASFDPR